MPKQEAREIKTPSEVQGVIFLVYKDGKFLVEEVTRKDSGSYGHIRIPGGAIEKGETAEEAMKREAKEELGIDVKSYIFLDTFEDVTLGGDYYIFNAFLILDYQGELRNQEPEKSNIYWLQIQEAWATLKLSSSRYVLSLSEAAVT